jgi:hypothetical protein
MAVLEEHRADVAAILARPRSNGADFWATPDGRWGTGSPFSAFDCVLQLTELGVKRSDPVMKGAAEVVFGAWQEDGKFRPAPKGTICPCHTANAARALCPVGSRAGAQTLSSCGPSATASSTHSPMMLT